MERKTAFELLAALGLLVLAFAGPAGAQYAGGSGTPDDPYLIATPEQLNAIGAEPNDWDKHFQLTADIDLAQYTGTEFNIIGREVAIETYQRGPRGAERLVLAEALIPFTGTFDGVGYAISNFTYLGWEVDSVGLFGFVADPNARITNLELRAPHIHVEDADAVGALVGCFEDGAIVNCHVREAVVLVEGVLRAGTLAGGVDGGAVAACSSDRGMVLDDDESYKSGSQVGGLIGRLGRAVLTDCFVDGGLALGIGSIGGLIGNKEGGAIENCWATATVMGDFEIGGLVGTNFGKVANSHASGDVWGGTYIGGLLGYNNTIYRGRGVLPEPNTIEACYATGTVIGQEHVGGLVGAGRGPFTNCHASGDVQGEFEVGGLIGYHESNTISACYATGHVTGEEMVGGLVGRALSTVSVTACYATGDVQGTEVVGGLVGMNRSTMLACYATGALTGEEAVGGLVGENEGQIVHCYATGSVGGEEEVGGLVGRGEDKNEIILCFWDIDTSGVAESDGGTGLTTAEMMTAATFLEAGWDFVGETENGTDDLWWIDEGVDYPRLWWEDMGIDY